MLEGEHKDNRDDKEGRLSIRTSVIVWLSGAVLGWVVAVLAIYVLLRAPDSNIAANEAGRPLIEQAKVKQQALPNPKSLSEIQPAAGPAGPQKPNSPAVSGEKRQRP